MDRSVTTRRIESAKDVGSSSGGVWEGMTVDYAVIQTFVQGVWRDPGFYLEVWEQGRRGAEQASTVRDSSETLRWTQAATYRPRFRCNGR